MMQLVKHLDNIKKHCIIELEGSILASNIKEIKKRKNKKKKNKEDDEEDNDEEDEDTTTKSKKKEGLGFRCSHHAHCLS